MILHIVLCLCSDEASLMMSSSGETWRDLLCGRPNDLDNSRCEGQQYSLPGCVKTQIEQGLYMPAASSMQVSV